MVRGRANPRHWTLPARLKRARRAAGLTALVLSQAAGVGKSLVSILEGGGGRVPRIHTTEQLARALGVSPAWLAFGIELPFEPATELRSKGFAARLSEARRERGLSMRAVDKRAGISPGSTRSLEAGTMPSLDTLELIANALGVSPAWLAFAEGPREIVRPRWPRLGPVTVQGGG